MPRWSLPGPYGGHNFRSRTEAKWAIFWDELGVKWEYEPQGFVTDGSAYLPDFTVFAAGGTLWAEIKPDWTADPEGIAKFRTFAAKRPQPSRAVLLTGPPSLEVDYLVIGGDDTQDDPHKGAWEDDTQRWRPCPAGHHFDLAYPGQFRAKFAEDDCADDFGGNGEERLRKAVNAALSYRFGKPAGGTAA
jgi:hypothetical protein